MTKSGHRGKNLSRCSALRASRREFSTQEVSGERTAPLGRKAGGGVDCFSAAVALGPQAKLHVQLGVPVPSLSSGRRHDYKLSPRVALDTQVAVDPSKLEELILAHLDGRRQAQDQGREASVNRCVLTVNGASHGRFQCSLTEYHDTTRRPEPPEHERGKEAI